MPFFLDKTAEHIDSSVNNSKCYEDTRKIPTDKLCDRDAGYGTLQCKWVTSCPGANGGNCFPDHVWSDTRRDEGYYTAVRSMEGIFGTKNVCDCTGKCPYTYAFGARCVLDLNV